MSEVLAGGYGPPYVIAVGNPYRQDDGVGPWVARRLREVGLEVHEVGDDLTCLSEAWSGVDRAVLIEAVSSGVGPGTLHVFEVGDGPLPAVFSRFSSHTVGLAEAVELSRVLGTLPNSVLIYGIEGRCFGMGAGLSPEVEKAAGAVVARVLSDFALFAARPTGSG
ncbi:MAG: hydrogenase maturation protease [Meiothermus sp.]|nr:hydrogenase maturation protease [Meiothermus sp.]